MSENMAIDHLPSENYFNLYKTWAQGGVGLCVSGNVMIDSDHLGEPYNVVIEKGVAISPFKKWAAATEGTDCKLWIQLNHPGRQSPNFLNKEPVAPSAIPLKKPVNQFFHDPRELSNDEIWEIIDRFAFAAKFCKDAGFAGVQIHGAHGYLVSQFLSPLSNQRNDEWGGSIDNRMKFVKEIYKHIRVTCGKEFPVGIKINSADFQKGGFTHEESIYIAKTLSAMGIDLIEISGGSYEAQVMMGSKKKSTKIREAYFLDYAKDIKAVIDCPLVVTGGFRSKETMERALESAELDMIGMARPLAINPNFPKELINGNDVISEVKPLSTGIKFLDKMFPLEIIWYTDQLRRMGKGLKPKKNMHPLISVIRVVLDMGISMMKKVRA